MGRLSFLLRRGGCFRYGLISRTDSPASKRGADAHVQAGRA